jgi:hypothetical protein
MRFASVNGAGLADGEAFIDDEIANRRSFDSLRSLRMTSILRE